MASNTVAPEAIDQTAEPLCAKIALTEPAISIGLFGLCTDLVKDSKEIIRRRKNSSDAEFPASDDRKIRLKRFLFTLLRRRDRTFPIQSSETAEPLCALLVSIPTEDWSGDHPSNVWKLPKSFPAGRDRADHAV